MKESTGILLEYITLLYRYRIVAGENFCYNYDILENLALVFSPKTPEQDFFDNKQKHYTMFTKTPKTPDQDFLKYHIA